MVNWTIVYKPKNEGDLDFRPFKQGNVALLGEATEDRGGTSKFVENGLRS